MDLNKYLDEMKDVGDKATEAPWRAVNEIDPNPIFLKTWGPDYKTMWWIQAGHAFGEGGNSPTSSTLKNITPKETMMNEKNVKFIATARNNWNKILEMNSVLLEVVEFYYSNSGLMQRHPALRAIEKCREIVRGDK